MGCQQRQNQSRTLILGFKTKNLVISTEVQDQDRSIRVYNFMLLSLQRWNLLFEVRISLKEQGRR